METTRIAELLKPFLATPRHSDQSEESAVLSDTQFEDISTYIDILLRWNARINLTAIRQPEEIVTRHFGESLFAARHLFPPKAQRRRERPRSCTAIDIGSGAGFPGVPIKIWAPHIDLTLIESNHKKAIFLREVIRALTLMNINVFPGRAQSYPNPPADLVTLRAVEQFEATLPISVSLVAPTTGGRLALLISKPQLARAKDLTPGFEWTPPIPIPLSSTRILAIATRQT
jgi:16S rRNA (guanine527-N7)-methyltransferase